MTSNSSIQFPVARVCNGIYVHLFHNNLVKDRYTEVDILPIEKKIKDNFDKKLIEYFSNFSMDIIGRYPNFFDGHKRFANVVYQRILAKLLSCATDIESIEKCVQDTFDESYVNKCYTSPKIKDIISFYDKLEIKHKKEECPYDIEPESMEELSLSESKEVLRECGIEGIGDIISVCSKGVLKKNINRNSLICEAYKRIKNIVDVYYSTSFTINGKNIPCPSLNLSNVAYWNYVEYIEMVKDINGF